MFYLFVAGAFASMLLSIIDDDGTAHMLVIIVLGVVRMTSSSLSIYAGLVLTGALAWLMIGPVFLWFLPFSDLKAYLLPFMSLILPVMLSMLLRIEDDEIRFLGAMLLPVAMMIVLSGYDCYFKFGQPEAIHPTHLYSPAPRPRLPHPEPQRQSHLLHPPAQPETPPARRPRPPRPEPQSHLPLLRYLTPPKPHPATTYSPQHINARRTIPSLYTDPPWELRMDNNLAEILRAQDKTMKWLAQATGMSYDKTMQMVKSSWDMSSRWSEQIRANQGRRVQRDLNRAARALNVAFEAAYPRPYLDELAFGYGIPWDAWEYVPLDELGESADDYEFTEIVEHKVDVEKRSRAKVTL